jgi:hypothetical protein
MRSNCSAGCRRDVMASWDDESESGGVDGGVRSCWRGAGRGPGEQNGKCRVGSVLVAAAAATAMEVECGDVDESGEGGLVETGCIGTGRANSVAIVGR